MPHQTASDISTLATTSVVPVGISALPPLEAGDHLSRDTFHARYLRMPSDFRAELIEGVVIVPSPVSDPHADKHFLTSYFLGTYVLETPGVDARDNGTILLGVESEPQPDLALMISPACGGATRIEDNYRVGPPELIVEVASSSESYDSHSKLRDYERAGVQEYAIVMLREGQVVWRRLSNGAYEVAPPDDAGTFRSQVFPGLWLDAAALLRGDLPAVLAKLREGLASPEHAAFVAELAQRRSAMSPKDPGPKDASA